MNETTIATSQNFSVLVDNVYQTHSALQHNAQRTVNINLTVRNYLIGCYIVEFEQKFQIWGAVPPKLQSADNKSLTIQGSMSPELSEKYPIAPEMLLTRLTFTHFVELLRRDDPLERLFYEVETIIALTWFFIIKY